MSQPSGGRRNVALAIAIIAGLVIGIFIKRLHIGLLIGVVLGVMIVGLGKGRG